MIRNLKVINFRSIQKLQNIELAPITVIYGGNGTGKSSLLYALLTLKNIILNTNQPLDSFFNLLIANLGGFQQVVFDHVVEQPITLGIESEMEKSVINYEVSVQPNRGVITLRVKGDFNLRLPLEVTFPYPGNQSITADISYSGFKYSTTWNGFTALQVNPEQPSAEAEGAARLVQTILNSPVEAIRQADFVPLRRGFLRPFYQVVSMSPVLVTEEEVATLLAQDPYLPGKLSWYLQDITGREFRVHSPPGQAIFYPQTVDQRSGVTTELVNDGFGTNQLIYFLAKALRSDTRLVCAEEPEINLHPTSIRKLAQAMIHMVKEEDKQFLISTHSESLVLALLAQVAKHELEPKELACYLTTKPKKATHFERQVVTDSGQVEGGLKSFMESELEDLKAFFED